ncbi:tenascin-like, partial [Cotesia glomerata]|uniref:tenascin-like n=1 Tax=Cotesia glomerata TaxID=32391 RepID=UPI001D002D51
IVPTILQDGNMCVQTTNLYCETDEDCVEMNGACLGGQGQCSAKYVMQEAKCLPTELTGRCSINSDCAAVKFAVCLEDECTCSEGFFTVNATTCVKALGKSCISDKDCAVRFSGCHDKKCQCNHGYTQMTERQCSAWELGTTCFDNSTCNLMKNAHCFESQCSCKDNHIEMNAFTCAPLLNAFCSDELKCASKNSVCTDDKCQCEFGYFPKSNYECVLRYLEQRCRIDEHCVDIPYAKCSDAGKCICHKNYVLTSPTTCSPTLGGYCASNRECFLVNAECFRDQCRCSPGYMQHSDDLCLPGKYLGLIKIVH